MDNGTNKLVTGLFQDRLDAENAVDAIFALGYSQKDVSVLMSDKTKAKHFAIEKGTQAATGASIGGAVGGTVGAVLAAIAAIGTSVILPGLGLVVAGPIAAALVGAGVGGATGGVVGALVGAGIPEYRAAAYEAGLRNGGILICVEARNDADASVLSNLLGDTGAEAVRTETAHVREVSTR
jgi:hypothetical protein